MAAATAATKAKKITGTFAELNAKLAYAPTTANGRGFLPPFMRTISHLLYAMGLTQDDDGKNVKAELTAAEEHFKTAEISEAFSTDAKKNLLTLAAAITAANAEFEGWDKDTRLSNLRALVNKAIAIGAVLDRELIGIRNSDPGSSL